MNTKEVPLKKAEISKNFFSKYTVVDYAFNWIKILLQPLTHKTGKIDWRE